MKRKIAIIAGGDSSEHEVSLRSAAGLYSFIDKERYDVTVVVFDGKNWKAYPQPLPEGKGVENYFATSESYPIDKNDFSFTRGGVKHTFDFAYITIHGTPGENGILQGYLDMIGMPYSCCGVLAAALTFNKYACNHYLSYFGFHIANSMMLRAGQKWPNAPKIADVLGLPCFIKSNIGGSSFGCTKVKTIEDIYPAIERAFKEGDEVICESFMQGTEVTCGVYKTKDKAVAFPITEVVTHNEFFDYDAKYKGQVDEITPARIPDAVRDKIQAETLRLYDIIGANGIIRVDWIITKVQRDKGQCTKDDVQINLLEVNTTPGMTPTSFIPQQVRAAGLDIKDVLTDIIENKFSK
ncbi:MAG: D-alanine--D-alanine ligase [Paludibacteraceae bacterium]|nr:D-alanine--D-alanine ligase [Paludibacteraceae bacterium]MBP5641985.1 D-alanine--D-alanine ligase [Paludibacteraceae bacterium]